jgi:hypothetical protein
MGFSVIVQDYINDTDLGHMLRNLFQAPQQQERPVITRARESHYPTRVSYPTRGSKRKGSKTGKLAIISI